MKKTAFNLTAIAAALLTSGCVSTELSTGVHDHVAKSRAIVDVEMDRAQPVFSSKDAYERSQEVDAPYIVGKSVPLARSVTLPPALQKDVKTAVMFADPWVSLSTAAERIMLATGLVVTIAPDVYLESSALQRKSIKDSGAGAAAAQPAANMQVVQTANPANPVPLPLPGGLTTTSAAPVASGLSSKGQRAPESANGFDLPRMNAPLAQILDVIATKLAIKWRYDERNNSIHFYRLVTKTWETPFRAAKASFKSSLQGETSNSNNQNAISTRSSTSTPVDEELRDLVELTAMRENVDSILTRSGNVFANPATGTITATDTTDTIDAADELIRNGIRSLSRMVRLRVQTIKVTTQNSGEAGVDLSAAVSRALTKLPDFKMSLGSAASLVSSNSGDVGLQILSGPAAGSTAVIRALKQVGDVDVSTEIPLSTRNRKGVYYNVRKTFSYVASTTPATAAAGGTGGTPGITTAQDSVGLKLFMYPEVTSRDAVMLTMSLDQSTLNQLEKFTSGIGSNEQSVQLPNIDGEGSSQQVPLRNGQTIVLTGFDTRTNQFDKRTLGDGIPAAAGGSVAAKSVRSTTIVLVTAEVADGVTD